MEGMKRLTARDEYGNASPVNTSIGCYEEMVMGLPFDDLNAMTELLNRLADYEDTGATPEECKEALALLEKQKAMKDKQ